MLFFVFAGALFVCCGGGIKLQGLAFKLEPYTLNPRGLWLKPLRLMGAPECSVHVVFWLGACAPGQGLGVLGFRAVGF